MADRYILAQTDADGNIILSPTELRIQKGDNVIWIARMGDDSTYIAGNFVGTQKLFTAPAYVMPGMGESNPATAVANIEQTSSWVYTCSEFVNNKALIDDSSGQGIIIVDPPPIDDDDDDDDHSKADESPVGEETTVKMC